LAFVKLADLHLEFESFDHINAVLSMVSTMSGMADVDCLICREHDGTVEIPGGFLIENDVVIAFHCPPVPQAESPYLGHVFVTPRRHTPTFAELNSEEAAQVGVSIAVLSAALKREGATNVYLATIGHSFPHLHVHLLPRWSETPPEVPWHKVDEWEGARRGGSGAVEKMTMRLRSHLRTET
jgi:histidine triad (HIT) family protein